MRSLKHVLTALVAGLLLVSASAFAAKPNPEDCPCWSGDAENFGMSNVIGVIDDCIDQNIWSYSDDKTYDILTVDIQVGEEFGGDCFHASVSTNWILSPVPWCTVTAGTRTLPLNPDGCETYSSFMVSGLSDAEVKACVNVWRQLRKDVRKLPVCE